MTYQELKTITQGKPLPLAGKNEDGENVIIEHRTVKQEGMNYFQLTTAQRNGWTRINHIYENGNRDEFFQK